MSDNKTVINEIKNMRKEGKHIVSIDEIFEMVNEGEPLDIPSFRKGQTMTVMVRQVDMVELAREGMFQANTSLQGAANELFEDKEKFDEVAKELEDQINNDQETADRMLEMVDKVAYKALVRPSAAEFKEKGIDLLQSQKMAIFQWAMGDTLSMLPFREGSSPDDDANS
jgi:hypothetical protein|nr:MAG TPA: hypothetical protein [Caudoviricetes sp.]